MSFYLVDDITQGTAKWHRWRRRVIGASDAAIIMGENRLMGRQQLINEKRGLVEPFSGNAATRDGHFHEEHARTALEKKFKESLSPTIVQDSIEPFLAASLDAINSPKNQVYEIKCGVRTYEKVEGSRKVPSYYVAQIQHMLMVTQMESLIFAAYRPNEPLLTFEVFRNEGYIRELRRKEKDFIRELEGYGHRVQYEFRGYQVGKVSKKAETQKSKVGKKSIEPCWKVEDGLLRFWDGSDYLEGEDPGLYDLSGEDHYWDGEQWCIPEVAGSYDLNGEVRFWNGESWE